VNLGFVSLVVPVGAPVSTTPLWPAAEVLQRETREPRSEELAPVESVVTEEFCAEHGRWYIPTLWTAISSPTSSFAFTRCGWQT